MVIELLQSAGQPDIVGHPADTETVMGPVRLVGKLKTPVVLEVPTWTPLSNKVYTGVHPPVTPAAVFTFTVPAVVGGQAILVLVTASGDTTLILTVTLS